MRKKILTIMAVLFALCVIGFIYKLQTDYYVKFDAKIPDMVTVEYGEKFEMPEVHAVAKHYLLGKKKDVEVSTEGTVDESKIGEYKIVFLAEYRKKGDSCRDECESHRQPEAGSYHARRS